MPYLKGLCRAMAGGCCVYVALDGIAMWTEHDMSGCVRSYTRDRSEGDSTTCACKYDRRRRLPYITPLFADFLRGSDLGDEAP